MSNSTWILYSSNLVSLLDSSSPITYYPVLRRTTASKIQSAWDLLCATYQRSQRPFQPRDSIPIDLLPAQHTGCRLKPTANLLSTEPIEKHTLTSPTH